MASRTNKCRKSNNPSPLSRRGVRTQPPTRFQFAGKVDYITRWDPSISSKFFIFLPKSEPSVSCLCPAAGRAVYRSRAPSGRLRVNVPHCMQTWERGQKAVGKPASHILHLGCCLSGRLAGTSSTLCACRPGRRLAFGRRESEKRMSHGARLIQ
jgi:hypothetical protein